MLLIQLAFDLFHLHDKVAHQKINDGGHGGKVEREEETDGFHRHSVVASGAKIVIKESGYYRHRHISDEPGNRITPAFDHQRTYRRKQRPQHHATGSDGAADAPLHDERDKQEQT